jgi:hypothetical protein
MSTWKSLVACSAACLAFAGCTTVQTPIVAGAIDAVGVSVSGGPQAQGANMVVGFRGAKFAVVPVESSQGDQLLLDQKDGTQKGFSVFAMLGLDVKGAAAAPCVGISQVVAVGPAATTWAQKAGGTVCE